MPIWKKNFCDMLRDWFGSVFIVNFDHKDASKPSAVCGFSLHLGIVMLVLAMSVVLCLNTKKQQGNRLVSQLYCMYNEVWGCAEFSSS